MAECKSVAVAISNIYFIDMEEKICFLRIKFRFINKYFLKILANLQ